MRKLIVGVATTLLSMHVAWATQSSIPFINADDVRAQGITGAGVTVAVIDTGVFYDHPGLVGRIAPGGESIIAGAFVGDDGEDVWGDGHGTYMSLIIVDQSGIAHDARILPVRVFGAGGGAFTADIVQAIDYVRILRAINPSIRVINLSLGGGFYSCPCDQADSATQAYQTAISAAVSSGIITFAATGNDGACGAISRPACVTSAVKVAASYDHQYPTVDYGDCADFIPPAYRITCFSGSSAESVGDLGLCPRPRDL